MTCADRFARTSWKAISGCALSACVYLPEQTSVYNADCQIMERHLTLKAEQIELLETCSGAPCAAGLVLIGAVTVASAVVSESIVVAGNVVYWFEKQGNCVR